MHDGSRKKKNQDKIKYQLMFTIIYLLVSELFETLVGTL